MRRFGFGATGSKELAIIMMGQPRIVIGWVRWGNVALTWQVRERGKR